MCLRCLEKQKGSEQCSSGISDRRPHRERISYGGCLDLTEDDNGDSSLLMET